MRNFIVSSVVILLLVSCGALPQPTQLAMIPSVELVTDTIVPTQQGLAVYQTERVATVLAIQTASATPRPTHTLTQTATIDPDPTSAARATRRVAYDKYCEGVTGYFYNDNWGICDRDSHRFTVFNLDGRMWQYSYDQLGVTTAGEGPDYMTRAIYWTPDGQEVYLTAFPIGYDPLMPFYGNATDLFQVDLENGEIKRILSSFYFYSVSISPAGNYLAYVIFEEPLQLVIQNLRSGEVWQSQLEQKYTQAGAFDWSRDESKVAYTLVIDGDECTREFAIRLLSINDKKSTTIIDDTDVDTCQPVDPMYYVVDVIDNSILLEQNGDIWVYTLSSQMLSLQATATATP